MNDSVKTFTNDAEVRHQLSVYGSNDTLTRAQFFRLFQDTHYQGYHRRKEAIKFLPPRKGLPEVYVPESGSFRL